MCLSLCCSLMLWNFAEADRLLSLVPFCRWWAWIYTKPTQVYASYILSLKITVRHCECGVQSRLIYVCYNIVENRTALFKESWWDPYTLYPIFHFPTVYWKIGRWGKEGIMDQNCLQAESSRSLLTCVSDLPCLYNPITDHSSFTGFLFDSKQYVCVYFLCFKHTATTTFSLHVVLQTSTCLFLAQRA